MARIDDAITAAEIEVTNTKALPETTDAEKATKATKVAAAEARVSALRDQKKAIQDDINDGVRGRLPDHERTTRESERKTVAAALGIPVENLTDEKLAEVREAYQGQQSEVEREKQRADAAEQTLTTAEAEAERSKKRGDTAKAALETFAKRSAVERALISQGVRHKEDDTRLVQAMRETDMSGVLVEIEEDEDGNLSVKGEVKGAEEAAKKTRDSLPEWFGGSRTQGPPELPRGRDEEGTGGAKSYLDRKYGKKAG